MSKTSEIDLCIGELRTAAQSLSAVANSLAALFDASAAPAGTFAQSGHGNDQKTTADPANIGDGKVNGAKSSRPKPVTLEQVRAVLAEKSRSGHTAKVRELLEKHGAAKLSEIDPQKYAALLAEAEVLGNG